MPAIDPAQKDRQQHPWFSATRTPRVLAHRGLVPADADGIAENSFLAVAAAHAAGAAYVESDCHVTRDGVVVLFHDDDLQRVAGDPRRIADVSLRELGDLMSDRGGLITLAQALDTFPTLRFNLDVKAPGAAEPVGRIVAPYAARVLLTSFSDTRRLAALRAAAQAGATMRPATSGGTTVVGRVLVGVTLRSQRMVNRELAGIDALQIPERYGRLRVLSSALVAAAHAAGTEVHVWTVNDPERMRQLFAARVDGIVTDRADIALKTLR